MRSLKKILNTISDKILTTNNVIAYFLNNGKSLELTMSYHMSI